MNVQFSAAYYDSSTEEAVLTVGFADNEDDPQHFLILQRAEEPDEQDEALDQDTYYVEIGNPSIAGYGGIDGVLVVTNKIIFTCSSTTSWCKMIKTIEIEITPELGSVDAIEASLRQIFIDTPTNVSRS
ncbi:hypothetical protein F157LOC_02092 [Pectobacterium brasiliense]|uniref:Imm10 family immunity protein n=1 Tax=Pectobacterium brasiliense TaxID=180957 RepID=UPI000CE69189|nr:Imm10 family immunity protein [Pectobacterium brasiliense]PPE59856.1 hypothetical protein F157LOC_02092 [Pectobacterium brasiliense]QSD37125.1 hypothetical protein H5A40_08480 [Pectobacterium brasiliense]